MPTLGGLLELLHDASERARPAQVTVTERRPGQPERSARLFADAAERYREEAAGDQAGTWYLVRDGERWLTWDADAGRVSGDTEPEGGPPAASFGFLLDPVELVAAFRFGPPSTSIVAGRPALTVEARPREGERGPAATRVGRGADAVELAFDAETGALLRSEARLAGEPFQRIEVSEIVYGPAPPETFLVAPP